MNGDALAVTIETELPRAAQLLAKGQKAQAIELLRQMLSLEGEGPFWGQVAQMLYQAGDLDGAEAAARNLLDNFPTEAQPRALLASILGDIGKTDEAITLYEELTQRIQGASELHYNLGLQLARSDRMDDARVQFGKALKIEPQNILAAEHLAYITKGEAPEALLGKIDDLLVDTAQRSAAESAALYYARATLLERQQDWEGAFAAFEHGAELMRTVSRANLDGMERYVERLKHSFSSDFFATNSDRAWSNERPVFIVGVPRSGTTLVETVLGAHSQLVAGGETGLLGLATMNFGSFEPPDLQRIDAQIAADANAWEIMGKKLEELHNGRFGDNHRVSDKNLGHHFFLGVIAMIASGAPIIYCRRDPVATAWSCFKTRFQRGNGWSYDFDSIGRYQQLYSSLMQHWQSVLPEGRILELAYEDLVARPDTLIPELLRHAGLDFEEACLTPHRSGMPVLTASMTEVREPIHTAAVSAWQRYEPWLSPHLDSLRAG